MNFVLPDPRLAASRRAQLAYSRISSSVARIVSKRRLCALAAPAAAVASWWISSTSGWLPKYLPAPLEVLQAAGNAWSSLQLQKNFALTLACLIVGYAIGAGLGLLLGTLMGVSRRAADYLHPTFKAMTYVPALAWIPLWIATLGAGTALRVVLVAHAAFVPVAINAFAGIRGVPPSLVKVGEALHFDRGQLLWRILLPAALPSIRNGLRSGLVSGWMALIAVEVVASTAGLGHPLVFATGKGRLDGVLVALISVGIASYGLHRAFKTIESRLTRWQSGEGATPLNLKAPSSAIA